MSSEAYIVLLESSIEDLQRALAAERARREKAEEVVDNVLNEHMGLVELSESAEAYRAQYPRVEQEK